jgi:D-alanine-D-alanine ligase
MSTSLRSHLETKNILVLCGGGGTEHDISLLSSQHIMNSLQLMPDRFTPVRAIIEKDFNLVDDKGKTLNLLRKGEQAFLDQTRIDFAIPCIHGPPGETGEIQSVLDFMHIPYLGAGHESSVLCFNKVSCKLWLSATGIRNTPNIFLTDLSSENKTRAVNFFNLNKKVFVKAASQGSSVGCYRVHTLSQLEEALHESFKYSQDVLIEKEIRGRELEISVFEHEHEIRASRPGEIIAPDGFYSFEEKYSDNSQTKTIIEAQGLSEAVISECQRLAISAFKALKLRDLSRVDFFLNDEGLFINEINTFPGMTPISMFPKMMEASGIKFETWLAARISKRLNNKN